MVGANIRALRIARGLTQEALADLAGLDSKTVSRAENGVYAISVDQVVRLARALGVPSSALFDDRRDRNGRDSD